MAPTGMVTPKQAGYDVVQSPRMSPENAKMIRDLQGQVQPGVTGGVDFLNKLAKGGDEDFWKQLEAPAMRQFNEFSGRTASRFSQGGVGAGSMSARRSSGFQNQMNSGAVDLAERLQGQRMGLQNNAIQQLLSLYSGLMGEDEFQYDLMEKQESPWNKWIGGSLPFIGAGVGAAGGAMFGGPGGALAGAKLGGTLGGMGSKAFFS